MLEQHPYEEVAYDVYDQVISSPIVGAGAYADNQLGAASSTGWGESIMKVLLTKTLCDLFEKEESHQAAKKAIQILEERVQGLGGVIGINKKGAYAFHYNTPKMAFAYIDDLGNTKTYTKYQL